MKFALVQTSLDPVSVDQLRAAFQRSSIMTAADAHYVAMDAYGVLVRELEIAAASALQLSLQRQGIETQVVAQDQLPSLPPTKYLRKLECHPGGLLIFDPMDRPLTLDWRQLLLVAAASVATTPIPGAPRPKAPAPSERLSPYSPDPLGDQKENPTDLLLEIVMGGGAARYSVWAEQLLPPPHARFEKKEAAATFTALVKGICAHTPKAILSRGAFLLKSSQPCLAYPSRRAFHEEITWLLWRIKEARGSLQAL